MEQIEKVFEKAEPKQKIKIENVLTSQEPTKVVKVVKPTVVKPPISKENINIPPRKEGFQNRSKANEIKENVLTATISPSLQSNQLQEVLTEPVEGKALNLEDFLKKLVKSSV